MRRKIALIIAGALLAGAFVIAKPVETQAALPCTYDIINDANAQIAAAQNAYALAQANENNLRAAFEAVKSQGPSSLAYIQAAAALQNAVNQKNYAAGQIQNAQAYLANIKGREAFEDDYLNSLDALSTLTKVQAAQTEAQGAMNIANAVTVQIKDVQNAIAGYQQQLATCPSVQAQIDALNVQLAALNADYNNKLAIANQKMAAYQALVAAGGYQNYTPKYIDYYHNRERNTGIEHCKCFDFYTNTCQCTEDCNCGESCCEKPAKTPTTCAQ